MKRYFKTLGIGLVLMSSFITASFGQERNNEFVYIQDIPVSYMEWEGFKFVNLDELENMGFDIIINEDSKKLELVEDYLEYLKPSIKDNYKVESKYLTIGGSIFINGMESSIYTYNNERYLNISDLYKFESIDILDREDSSEINFSSPHIFTYQDKSNILIDKKEDGIYMDGQKIGFSNNNVDMISMTSICKKLGFDNGGKKEGVKWIEFGSKNGYKFEISLDSEQKDYNAYVYSNNKEVLQYIKLTAEPIDKEDGFYLAMNDLKRLMNLEFEYVKAKSQLKSIGEYASESKVLDNQIFVIDKSQNLIYQTDLNTKTTQIFADAIGDRIAIKNNYIYYSRPSYLGESYLKKISLTTKTREDIMSDVDDFVISNDKIYSIRTFDQDDQLGRKTGIYQTDLNGKSEVLIVDGNFKEIRLSNNILYFVNRDDNNSIYSYDIIDQTYNKLGDIRCDQIEVSGDKIYFSNQSGIYMMNLDGSFVNNISYIKPYKFYINNNDLYILDFKNVYKYKLGNSESKLVYKKDEYLLEIIFAGSKVFIVRKDQISKFNYMDVNTLEVLKLEQNDIVGTPYFDRENIFYKSSNNEIRVYNSKSKMERILDTDIYYIFYIWDNYIYYYAKLDSGYIIKRINVNNAKDIQTLDKMDKDAFNIVINNDGIYYLRYKENGLIDIVKTDHKGLDKKIISADIKGQGYGGKLCFYDEYIYYNINQDIYIINKDGSGTELLTNLGDIVQIKENKIFLFNGKEFYYVDLQGKNKTIIMSDLSVAPRFDGRYFYSYDYKEDIKIIDSIDFSQKTFKLGSDIAYLVEGPLGSLYFVREDNKIYKLSASDLSVVFVANGDIDKLKNFDGDSFLSYYEDEEVLIVEELK